MILQKNKPKRIRIKRTVIIFFILLLIPVVINITFGDLDQFKSIKHFIQETSRGMTVGFVLWAGNTLILKIIEKKLNWLENPVKANRISLLSLISFGIAASLIVAYIYEKYIWRTPQESLMDSVVVFAFIATCVNLIIVSIYYSRSIISDWVKTMKNEEKLKHESLIARYEALKNQVNPHFLFNTLNTLTGIVEKNPEKASEFIRKLSGIYRYVLEQKDKELINLNEEMKFVNDYIYLSKIRYGDGLNVNYNIEDNNYLIVPLGLQILIENTMKHNIISDDQPLKIEIGADSDYIFIRNNLQRKSSVEKTKQIGLDNLIKRYEYLTGKKVEIMESKTHFEVKLPIVKNREL